MPSLNPCPILARTRLVCLTLAFVMFANPSWGAMVLAPERGGVWSLSYS